MSADFQSALNPAGPQGAHILRLTLLLTAVATLVYVAVELALLRSLRGRTGSVSAEESDRKSMRVVSAAVTATVVILFGLLVATLFTGRSMAKLDAKDPLKIEVTGNQWWWEVRYVSHAPSDIFTTANEIHLPAGRPVQIDLRSNDVIHSFWVPNLHGKRDAIPSRVNTIYLRADQPGSYRGQCAEFCGLQHAHMSLWVIVEPVEQFEQWRNAQLQPAPEPQPGSAAERGKHAFLSLPCVACHSVRGTVAGGQVAPDLTHIASRKTIAAGTLENKREHLLRWVKDSQSVKPGNRMPGMDIPEDQLNDVVTYLETLR